MNPLKHYSVHSVVVKEDVQVAFELSGKMYTKDLPKEKLMFNKKQWKKLCKKY